MAPPLEGWAAPKEGNGCGGDGQSSLVVVAIVVSAVVAPLAASALSGGAVSFGAAAAQLTGVAVGAVVGGVSNAVGQMTPFRATDSYRPNAFMQAIPGAAGGVAGAAARSLITGTDFGDNLRAVLPDVIGAALGNAIAGKT